MKLTWEDDGTDNSEGIDAWPSLHAGDRLAAIVIWAYRTDPLTYNAHKLPPGKFVAIVDPKHTDIHAGRSPMFDTIAEAKLWAETVVTLEGNP